VRLNLDRIDEAMADANKAAELSERDRFSRLYIARHVGDWQLAIDDASALIAIEPGDAPTLPYLYSVRGLARVEAGDVDGGMADIEEALRIAPAQPAALDRRAYARYLAGDYVGAESDLEQALLGLSTLPPETRADLYFHRALVLEATGRPDLARSEIQEALNYVEIPVTRRAIEEVAQRLEQ
jgi:tetratricopeptide (TPR) repeat protein